MANRFRPNRTRDSLLESLQEVFIGRGYEGATLTQLARATGLGKASLYHHFPGGKAEMAQVLLREAVSSLEQSAFSRLTESRPPADRLRRFIDGFDQYVDGGRSHCLVAVLGQGSFGAQFDDLIAGQFRDWQRRLARTFEDGGQKPKRADRSAQTLLSGLYGYLLTARLLNEPDHFRRGAKRLKKDLPETTS